MNSHHQSTRREAQPAMGPLHTPVKRGNPWPLVITLVFVLFFGGLAAFIVFATTQRDDLVRADYYEAELRYQQQFERLERTRPLEESIGVRYDPRGEVITVQLPMAHAAECAGLIELYRPSDARLDRQVPLALTAAGTQAVPVKGLQAGLWKIRIHWTAREQEYYLDRPLVVPARPF